MLLAADIGNTSIRLGFFEGQKLVQKVKLASDRSKSDDEYAVLLSGIFAMNGIDTTLIEGVIISSVVPTLTHIVSSALSKFCKRQLIVGSGIKTGLNIRVESPHLVGSDIVADTVAAMNLVKAPFVVIDLGTATTLTVINEKSELCGCTIIPGMKLSLDALCENCALISEVMLSKPSKLIGTNTADSINSGLIYGTAFMIDGFIDKIREDYSFGDSLSIVATGGLSDLVIPECRNKIQHEPNLTLKGLAALYYANNRKSN